MIIYNVTINIDDSVHNHWLEWMKTEHIPQVLGTGKFEKATFSQVLVEEEMGGQTYSVQYFSYSREALDAYYREDAERLRSEGLKKFADKMLAFRTELQIVDEYKVKFK
ncbi:DUF4286 family protein [Psychroserpens sp. SPM9]|uniref:DUF4286 family protein n=1 Tax=Psychroserpens sp. SPM9 TaxID=2975598 RepID=UPI0021A333E3|nr:DUF4286 family protein [Psychroserpens sp. SPM9]MDG5490841.1 DUF4286 family protein [Psychroserpens sp. SPM9]